MTKKLKIYEWVVSANGPDCAGIWRVRAVSAFKALNSVFNDIPWKSEITKFSIERADHDAEFFGD